MTRPESSASQHGGRRPSITVPAFLIGIPLAVTILYLIHHGPFQDPRARRYVSHPAEIAEVVLFCCAMAGLGAKLIRSVTERTAFRIRSIPAWDGQPVPIAEANRLRSGLDRISQRLQGTYLVSRIAAVLDFLVNRQSAEELDDQMRTLADNDSFALEGSYALIRIITWAIPILGFLGTVLGITQAISGVTPEVLEKSLSTVTDGLALAFDTTALGLALTMITMFVSFIVERAEQGVLEAVDRFADRQLAHRFERIPAEGGEFMAVLRGNTQVLLRATEQLVKQQAEIWSGTLAESRSVQTESESRLQERLAGAIEAALERTLATHTHRLSELEGHTVAQGAQLLNQLATLAMTLRTTFQEQQTGLSQIAQGIVAQAQVLTQVQEGEQHLIKLQEVLHQNLSSLAGTGAFDQAVHSLTAAIHLLTARFAEVPSAGRLALAEKKRGAAA